MNRSSGPVQALLSLLAVLVSTVPAAAEDATAAPRAAMAEAMAKMMEAMGFLGPAMPGSMPSPLPGSIPGSISGIMPNPMAGTMPSGTEPKSLMDQGLEKGSEALQQMTEGMKLPSTTGIIQPWGTSSRLDGVWEGRNGELLIVQGNRFRIYPGASHYVDGYIQLRGDRLAMYNPENEHIRPFEFAESEGRLALRDPAGTLFLYRRLWLDQPGEEAAQVPELRKK